MSQNKKRFRKFSITINPDVAALTDIILTPEGFLEPPKGSYSQLVSSLFGNYIAEYFNTDLLTVLGAFNEVGADEEAIKKLINAKEGG